MRVPAVSDAGRVIFTVAVPSAEAAAGVPLSTVPVSGSSRRKASGSAVSKPVSVPAIVAGGVAPTVVRSSDKAGGAMVIAVLAAPAAPSQLLPTRAETA